VEDLLQKLIQIESVNPALDERGAGETALAAFLMAFCRERDISCEAQPVKDGRCNVLARVQGTEEGELLFVAHMDTVPAAGWQRDPFTPWLAENRIYGRGSCDTKASLAAMLTALDLIKRTPPRKTIIVAGSVDEEYRKIGADALAARLPRFEGAVIGEPTDLDIVVAHKGSARWQIEATGWAAHSSVPENGRNAITAMAGVLTELHELNHRLRLQDTPLTGGPSLTVSLIEGGSDICTVPARCTITIDRRLVPGEVAEEAIAAIDAILARVQQQHDGIRIRSLLPASIDPPMTSAISTRLAAVAQDICAQVAGKGVFRGVPYGTDGSRLSAVGIPCVVVGPGNIERAHAIDEYVEIDQLVAAVEIYRSIMLAY
jgi:acetylornithine deacetylase